MNEVFQQEQKENGHKLWPLTLFFSGCNVNAQDSSGNTALHVAQMKKSLPGVAIYSSIPYKVKF